MKKSINTNRNRLIKKSAGLMSLLLLLQFYVFSLLPNINNIWGASPYVGSMYSLFTVVDYVSGGLNIGSNAVGNNGTVTSTDELFLSYQFKADSGQLDTIINNMANTANYSVYIEIPDGLKCIESTERHIFLSYDEVVDTNGDPIEMQFGTLHFDPAIKGVYLTFDGDFWAQIQPGDEIEDANIYLSCKLDMEDIGFGNSYPINIYQNTSLNIAIGDPATPPTITKTGSFTDNQFTWTITFNPGTSEYVYPVTVTDVFKNKYHEFADNVTIKQGLVNFADYSYSYSGSTDSDGDDVTEVGFVINSKPAGTLTITYNTALTAAAFGDGEYEYDTTVTNNALIKDKNDDPLNTPYSTATYTATAPAADKVWIKKETTTSLTSGVFTSKTINWKITVNTWNLNYNDLKVTDELPEGLILDADSIYINGQQLSADVEVYDENTGNWSVAVSTDISGPVKFRFDLPEVSTGVYEPVYTITYTTKVEESYLAPEVAVAGIPTFINTSALDIDWSSYDSSTPPAPESQVGPIGLDNHIIYKSLNSYNTRNHTMTWMIILNPYGLYVDSGGIRDVLPQGLKYISSSSNNPSKVSVSCSDGTNIIIDIGQLGTSPAMITLVTELTNPDDYGTNKTTNFTNVASFDGNLIIGGNTETISDSASYTGTFYSSVLSKAVSNNYDYNTNIITWRVAVNSNAMPMPDNASGGTILTDIIPKYQSFVEDSIRWGISSTYTSTSNKYLTSTEIRDDVSLVSLSGADEGKSQLSVKLHGKADNTLIYVFFQTKVDVDGNPDFRTKTTGITIANEKVTFHKDGYSDDVRTNISQSISNSIITKNGTASTDSISYSVNVNPNGMTLTDCKLTDEFSAGLRLDLKSVKLYKATVSTSGVVTGTSTPASDGIWSWSYEAADKSVSGSKNKIVISFSETISDRYTLVYECFASANGTYTNAITLEGAAFNNNINRAAAPSRTLYGTGTASRLATLSVTKQDNKNNNAIMNVEFYLYTKISGVDTIVDRAVTDINGGITFNNLTPGLDYWIVEAVNPHGYTIGAFVYDGSDYYDINDYKFNLNAGAIKAITITNNRQTFGSTGKIKIAKVNEYGAYLEDAEFKLTDDDDGNKLIGYLHSGSDGIVGLPDTLTFGNYTLEETAAPESHLLNPESFKLIVDSDGNYALRKSDGTAVPFNGKSEAEILNVWDKANTKLTITKVDGKTNVPIGNVGFELYYTDINNAKVTVDTGFTDSAGILTFSNLEPYRDYRIIESDGVSLYGYDIVRATVSSGGINSDSIADFKYTFKKAEEQGITVYNSRVETDVAFIKVNDFGRTVSGAGFKLTDNITGNEYTAVSDKNGIIKFSGLSFGDYTLVETVVPMNHLSLSGNVFHVTVEKNKTVTVTREDSSGNITPLTPGISGYVEIINLWDVNQDYIKILKKDEITGLPIEGVVFGLYTLDNGADKLLASQKTDSAGILMFSGLEPYRDYWIEETAPYGYKQVEKLVSLDGSETFVYNGNWYHFTFMDSVHKEITVYNYRNTADVTFLKVNENNGELSGAEFKLKGLDFPYEETKISRADGKVIFTDVPFGEYELREIKEPAGHYLNTEVYKVTVFADESYIIKSEDGKTIENSESGNGKIINKSIPYVTLPQIKDNTPPETTTPPVTSVPDEPENTSVVLNQDDPNGPGGPEYPDNSDDISEAVYTKTPDIPSNPGKPTSINAGTESGNPATSVNLPIKIVLLTAFILLFAKITGVIKKSGKK